MAIAKLIGDTKQVLARAVNALYTGSSRATIQGLERSTGGPMLTLGRCLPQASRQLLGTTDNVVLIVVTFSQHDAEYFKHGVTKV